MKFFNNGWDEVLEDEFEKPYFKTLLDKVDEEYEKHKVYPPRGKIFSALTHCDIKDVKVVILGQDPYHEEGQAHGMCFSVMPGVVVPPSLKNIYKEIEAEYGFKPPNHGYLVSWSNQGVLLLNTTLTVREHEANSHSTYGWQKFTDRIIQEVNKQEKTGCVFCFGAEMQSANKKFIDENKHLVLTSAHPSPLSAYQGFLGNGHFKNKRLLKMQGRKEIDWQIKDI